MCSKMSSNKINDLPISTSNDVREGLGNFKSICIVIVVIGCFAVLWPKIFYPMLLYGLNSRNSIDNFASNNKNNYILPSKVLEAMRQSPSKDSKSQKLPGRPQFYTGKRELSTLNGQNSVWNIFVPLYAIILIVIFMFALFKLSFKSDSTTRSRTSTSIIQPNIKKWCSLHDPNECRECQYDLMQNKNVNDSFTSRNTYRTFDYYGRKNVSRIMHSLVEDVKTFRKHLIKTKNCACKLAKCNQNNNENDNSKNDDDNQAKNSDVDDKLQQQIDVAAVAVVDGDRMINKKYDQQQNNNNDDENEQQNLTAENDNLIEKQDDFISDNNDDGDDDYDEQKSMIYDDINKYDHKENIENAASTTTTTTNESDNCSVDNYDDDNNNKENIQIVEKNFSIMKNNKSIRKRIMNNIKNFNYKKYNNKSKNEQSIKTTKTTKLMKIFNDKMDKLIQIKIKKE